MKLRQKNEGGANHKQERGPHRPIMKLATATLFAAGLSLIGCDTRLDPHGLDAFQCQTELAECSGTRTATKILTIGNGPENDRIEIDGFKIILIDVTNTSEPTAEIEVKVRCERIIDTETGETRIFRLTPSTTTDHVEFEFHDEQTNTTHTFSLYLTQITPENGQAEITVIKTCERHGDFDAGVDSGDNSDTGK